MKSFWEVLVQSFRDRHRVRLRANRCQRKWRSLAFVILQGFSVYNMIFECKFCCLKHHLSKEWIYYSQRYCHLHFICQTTFHIFLKAPAKSSGTWTNQVRNQERPESYQHHIFHEFVWATPRVFDYVLLPFGYIVRKSQHNPWWAWNSCKERVKSTITFYFYSENR